MIPFCWGNASQTKSPIRRGIISTLGYHANLLGNHALLVSDTGIKAAGHVGKVIRILEDSGIKVTTFDESIENPTESSVSKCVAVARESKIDLIIGLGGGSSMDTAKGCNFLLTNGGKMEDFLGVGKALHLCFLLSRFQPQLVRAASVSLLH